MKTVVTIMVASVFATIVPSAYCPRLVLSSVIPPVDVSEPF